MANDAQMPELDAAIERLKAATPKTAPWTVWDFSDRGEVPIDKEIAIILNAVVSGELTRAPDPEARLVEAARAALNYLENTEGEFGITLGSATGLRAALAAMEASHDRT